MVLLISISSHYPKIIHENIPLWIEFLFGICSSPLQRYNAEVNCSSNDVERNHAWLIMAKLKWIHFSVVNNRWVIFFIIHCYVSTLLIIGCCTTTTHFVTPAIRATTEKCRSRGMKIMEMANSKAINVLRHRILLTWHSLKEVAELSAFNCLVLLTMWHLRGKSNDIQCCSW